MNLRALKRIGLAYLLCIILFLPFKVSSAEIFQISSSSLLRVGDQNRIYKIQLPCVHVDPSNEEMAVNWLKETLPRKSKVNLKPTGYMNGLLLARVIKISSQKDIGEEMVSKGLADNMCNDFDL